MSQEDTRLAEIKRFGDEIDRLGGLVETMATSEQYTMDEAYRTETRRLQQILHSVRQNQIHVVDSILSDEHANISDFIERLGGHIDSLQDKIETAETVIDVAAAIERIASMFTPFGILGQLGLH